jgi:signal transduction histidine kinase
MAERLRSVRVRLTLAAAVVTAVAVALAGAWLVHTVDDSLRDRQREQDAQRLDELRTELEQGRRPSELEVVVPGRTTFFEIRLDGQRVAATPGYSDLAPGRGLRTTLHVEARSGSIELVATSPLEPIDRSVDAVRSGLLITLPLLVGAVALLAWILAGRALRPVESIRSEVEVITGTTLDRRVPVPASGDEVARLAQTMNAMLDRLEEASSRQQRFVADASHELRSPVAAIRTELEVAQRTATAADWPAIADRLLAEEARLEAVISDLLLLASLDEGAQAPDAVAVDIAVEAREEARQRRPDRADVTIEVDAPGAAVVQGSRMQLRRAMANLLDNAGRHARTTVRLSVHERDGRVRVLVDDDGPGIPVADHERVFERFVRLDEHRARAGAGGAGLGLSLVRRIVERHHGTASIDVAPLGGARIVLDLPAGSVTR